MGQANIQGGTLMASAGHRFRHMKQLTHFSAITWVVKVTGETSKASQGQKMLQKLHPMHDFSSIHVVNFVPPFKSEDVQIWAFWDLSPPDLCTCLIC